jgi:hypothetical protein
MSENTVGASAISCSYSTLTLFFRHQNRLADVMFGDESDEDATGAKKEYTFKPKARGRQKNCDDDDDDDDDDDSNSSENDNDSNC